MEMSFSEESYLDLLLSSGYVGTDTTFIKVKNHTLSISSMLDVYILGELKEGLLKYLYFKLSKKSDVDKDKQLSIKLYYTITNLLRDNQINSLSDISYLLKKDEYKKALPHLYAYLLVSLFTEDQLKTLVEKNYIRHISYIPNGDTDSMFEGLCLKLGVDLTVVSEERALSILMSQLSSNVMEHILFERFGKYILQLRKSCLDTHYGMEYLTYQESALLKLKDSLDMTLSESEFVSSIKGYEV